MRAPAAASRAARALAVLALAACASPPAPEPARRPLDLWPFVVRDARPVAGIATTRIAGPFFESWAREGAADEDADEIGWTLRPFAAGLEDGEARNLEFLYPLGELRRDEQGTRLRVTPLVDHVFGAPESKPEEEARGWTFLLAFGGRTREGARYGGLFPLAGFAEGRFGLERLDFFLFPLFGRSREASGYTRVHVLWPFFSWGSGGGRRTLRVWPLYGSDVREGEWSKRFALWPFVHWQTERPGEPDERRVRLFLPFYGATERAHARSRMWLGPVFMRAENDLTGARSTDLLWPFVHWARRPASESFAGSSEIRVEPFYRHAVAPGRERTGALFGLVERSRGSEGELAFDSFRVAFLARFQGARDASSGASLARRELWPFFRYEDRTGEGGRNAGFLRAPWLLPVRGEGFERHALGLFTGYDRLWRDGERRTDWLWGLARSRDAEGYELDAVSWVWRAERSGGERRADLFGIPVGVQRAEDLALPTDDAARPLGDPEQRVVEVKRDDGGSRDRGGW
jgi:hypothetical protein